MQHSSAGSGLRSTTARLTLVALAAAVLATGCATGEQAGAQAADTIAVPPTSSSTTVPVTTTTVPVTTTTVAPTTTTTTVPETTTTVAETTTTLAGPQPLAQAIQAVGTADGEETGRIQQRLLDLGFWLVAVDGDFGQSTKQAVLAFQKYYGLERTGSMDQPTADLLSSALAYVTAKDPTGTRAEVDKDRQILTLVSDGTTRWVINASSGSGQYYLEENQKKPGVWESGRSVTPSGEFHVNRERPDGWWEGDLGKIYRPKYFNGGIAIHGSGNIPAYPASHGCVRVSTAAMDMIWDTGLVPKGTTVVVHGSDMDPKGPKPTPPAPTPTTVTPDTVTPDTTVAAPADTTAAPETTVPAAPETTAVAAPDTAATTVPAG